MNSRTALPLTLAACLLAAACSDDPDLSGTSSSARPTASAAATAPASATGSPSPAADAPFEASTARDEQEASGGPLSVTSVRVGRHDGYDRVVFELDGREPGVPGWQVEYVDDPRRDGSGDRVEVEGDKTLVVLVRGTGYPFDTGVEEADEARVPGDVEVVEDVVLGSVFEGVYEAFIGTSHEAPFRVFRLSDPARVVVDIRHE
jgi:hypothetical protein